jgi:integrase
MSPGDRPHTAPPRFAPRGPLPAQRPGRRVAEVTATLQLHLVEPLEAPGRQPRSASPSDGLDQVAGLAVVGLDPRGWPDLDDGHLGAEARREILLGTGGLRRGEALGLRRADVDLDGGKVTIRQAIAPVGTRIVTSRPKTDRGSRDVHLDGHTVAAMRARLKSQAEERLAWGPAYQDHGLAFCHEDSRPLVPGEVSKTFRRLVKRAGLPPIRLHDLRHGVATAWLEAGINPLLVSERLGHASAAFTLDAYSHVRPKVHAEAAARAAEHLFGPADASR